ncbi:MAG: guanylate kinase [Planctomycetes bacterium]|nr:guanylate kinase [Planctomycetota bacterium]
MTQEPDHNQGKLFVISGPSGSGKTSIVARLRGLPGVFYSLSVTSRQPRSGERDGVDYHFVTREKFEKMAAEGRLAEYAEVAGNLYGTPVEDLECALAEGLTALVDIDVHGAMQIRKGFPKARLVFVSPVNMDVLEKRLRARGTESEENIRRRLALAKREMEFMPKYDHMVVNDELDKAVEEVRNIILGM